MPESTAWDPPAPTPDSPPEHGASVLAPVAIALAASTVLTAGWGLLSGLTERHYVLILPAIGTVISIALTSTTARRRWFPAVAALLGFAVGYLGDIAAIALILYRHGISLATLGDHFLGLIRAVNDGHSALDWTYFIATGLTAAVTTAARQKTLAARARRTGQR